MNDRTAALASRTTVQSAWPWLVLFVFAVIALTAMLRPFAAGLTAFDATASVLYFERLVAGQELETFVNTTPKPLLTIVFGVGHGFTGDWRAVTWLSILASASGVTLGSMLALRVAGPFAALAAAIFLLFTQPMVIQAAWAHGLPWAVACWMGTGIALTGRRQRFGTAGLLMLLGCLARQETFLLLGVASLLVAVLAATRRLPRGAWWLLIGWGAVPAMLLHDWRLAGDPLWSFRVAAINASDSHTTRSVRAVARMILGAWIADPAVTVVAVLGIVGSLRTYAGRITTIGIATIALGTSALFLFLAWQDRQTLYYYLHPISVALGFGAALGIGVMARGLAAWSARAKPGSAWRHRYAASATRLSMLAVVGAIVIGPVLVRPSGTAVVDELRGAAERSDYAAPVLRSLVGSVVPIPPAPGPEKRPAAAGFRILVPRGVQARLAVDPGLPLTVVGRLRPDRPTDGLLHDDLIVYYDPHLDRPDAVPAVFQGDSTGSADGVRFRLVDRGPDGTSIWQSAR